MRYLGGHLGSLVSPLVDGQLDASTADRAWSHVHVCPSCRRAVEHEGWVKTRLAMSGDPHALPDASPPEHLVGSLVGLIHAPAPGDRDHLGAAGAWAAVHAYERHGRGRRRAGVALVGVGSVSAAVLGLAALGGGSVGSSTPPTPPTAQLTRPVASPADQFPADRWRARLPGLQGESGLQP